MDRVVAFRISPSGYEELRQYAQDNDMTMSDVVRRAIRWMMLLYDKKDGRKR